jgi:hypothetical protein
MTGGSEKKVQAQAPTGPITAQQIVRSKEFNGGVVDVRLGRPPRFDDPIAQDWNYERGRQWALLAPMRLPTTIGRRANPEAVALLRRFFAEGAIQ